MNAPEFPNFEHILTNETEKLTLSQYQWYNLLRLVDAIYYHAGSMAKERLRKGYNRIKLSDFILSLASLKISCGKSDALVTDKLMMIAEDSVYAVTRIVSSPKTALDKQVCKQHISKIKSVGSRTVEWLAQRPQETLAEKIKPSNKLLTQKIIFTPDTKENRLLRYYYDRLYRYISSQLERSACANCSDQTCKMREGINSFLYLKNKIRHSELSEVQPKPCVEPNNVLMCDKYYKMIWDSFMQVKNYEESIKLLWNKFEDYLLGLELLFTAAKYLQSNKVQLVEQIVYLEENAGLLSALTDEPIKEIVFVRNDSEIFALCISEGKITEKIYETN